MTQPQDDIPVAEPVIAPIVNINDIFDELNRVKNLNDQCIPCLKDGVASAVGAIEAIEKVIEHMKTCEGPSDLIDDIEEIKEGYDEDKINSFSRLKQLEGENMLIKQMTVFLQKKYIDNINE